MSFVVVVTGANRGIGTAICDGILSASTPKPVVLYACSRAGKDLGLKGKVEYPKLDITDKTQIQALVDKIKQDQGGVDVLINNAGVNLDDDYSLETAKQTLETNYRGTLEMCRSFLPLLKDRQGSRIVNLSSVASQLNHYSPEIQERFRSVKTLEEVQGLADEYLSAVEANKVKESGWGRPQLAYSVSKALMNGFTQVLAKENSEVLINACCPGWVSSDMGHLIGKPPKSLEEGARVPLNIALKDIGGTTGKYWANSSVSGTGEGQVQKW
ncbi:hypothetical protein HD553DRAFT_71696 [Filobasidium floriforme]|uniref:uncharacterized protein n=1 Tax=Filobasidium floriforme TaxID=5210 RepID=UPI001E8D060A|nr:uncharacterized protein HD553DRAFT_71696 [Filobasidium floriforme]KAH8082353.1 hypothetical protein HD553DRAFT_71696 [Filobasidium floriforme]